MTKNLLLFVFLLTTGISQAATYQVMNTSDAGAGSLRQAILDANSNSGTDTVVFSSGTDGMPINITSGNMDITDELAIIGNGPLKTMITDDGTGFTFAVAVSITTTFRNLSISDAESAINTANPAGDLTVINCVITNCSLYAIFFYSNAGNLLVDNCYIHNNANGVWTQNSMDYTVTNSTFISNSTSGAILMAGGFLGNGYFANNTLYKNNYGFNVRDPQSGKSIVLANNTVYDNDAVGIYVMELDGRAGNITMANNISYSNALDFVLSDVFGTGSVNPSVTYNIVGTCNSSHGCPTWYSTSNPMLDTAGAENNGGFSPTVALTSQSTNAIDSASTSFAPTYDQRGYFRDGAPDIGSYEYNGSNCLPSSFSMTETSCKSYTSPSGKYTWTSDGTYYDTLVNATGCDSLLTVNLTVVVPETGVIQLETQLISKASGVSYQWVKCHEGYAPIPDATGPSYTATEDGEYAVIINDGGCIDTSGCYTVNTGAVYDNGFNGLLKIAPNPTTGTITIDPGRSFESITNLVKDAAGRVIATRVVAHTGAYQLHIDAVPGIYFIEIVASTGESARIKVVKSQL